MPASLTYGSLFSGIGGIDLGLERAGMECRWQVEVDPYCQAILNQHWPEVPTYGDVRSLSASSLETVDTICGGFPCQPVSHAGRRQGQSDPRWLWPEFARLVDEIRPRYVIVENVPGLYSMGGAEVVADLATMGYDVEWGCVSAEAFGAPHERQRFILVAHSSSSRRRQDAGSTHGDEGEDAGESTTQADKSGRDGEGYPEGVVAHSDSDGRDGQGLHEVEWEGVFQPARSGGGSKYPRGVAGREGEEMADPDFPRLEGPEHPQRRDVSAGSGSSNRILTRGWRTTHRATAMAYTYGQRRNGRTGNIGQGGWRESENGYPIPWFQDPADNLVTPLGRVANGIPHRVDRVRSLGNSVVPAIFQWIGLQVMKDAKMRGYID